MSSTRPHILFITTCCPFAPSYGGQIRTLWIGRLLQQCGDVRLVLVPRMEPETALLARTREEFVTELVVPRIPKRIQGLRERLEHELDPWFLNTQGVHLDAASAHRLRQLAAAHDVVWIHGLSTANMTNIRDWPGTVLDVDDVLSQYYRSELRSAGSLKQWAFAARAFWVWKRREAILLRRFGILAVCSEADRQYLGADERIHTIPNGYGLTAVDPQRCRSVPPRIGFIGKLDYPPNRDGLEWFIKRVWPTVKSKCPQARLRLVGAETDSEIRSAGPDIDGLGFMEDASSEIATWSLAIVPIRVGGGTRIKIAESFSRKCPVVATSWGAFGYEVKSGEELLLADTPETFAETCLSILKNPCLGEQLAERAWRKYVENWTWSAIRPKVEAAVEHCLSLPRRPIAAGGRTNESGVPSQRNEHALRAP